MLCWCDYFDHWDIYPNRISLITPGTPHNLSDIAFDLCQQLQVVLLCEMRESWTERERERERDNSSSSSTSLASTHLFKVCLKPISLSFVIVSVSVRGTGFLHPPHWTDFQALGEQKGRHTQWTSTHQCNQPWRMDGWMISGKEIIFCWVSVP